MTTSAIPRLGRRGGGWVALQFLLLGALTVLGGIDRDGWPEGYRSGLRYLGVLVISAGTVVAVLAVTRLGAALTAAPAPIEGARLRTDGVYGVVRHPIYSALLLITTGFALGTTPWAFVVVALLTAVLELKRRVEEDFLSATYPEYADYRHEVPCALVPHIW